MTNFITYFVASKCCKLTNYIHTNNSKRCHFKYFCDVQNDFGCFILNKTCQICFLLGSTLYITSDSLSPPICSLFIFFRLLKRRLWIRKFSCTKLNKKQPKLFEIVFVDYFYVFVISTNTMLIFNYT